jgi:hypothetical protein
MLRTAFDALPRALSCLPGSKSRLMYLLLQDVVSHTTILQEHWP